MKLKRFSHYSFLFGMAAVCLGVAGQVLLQSKYIIPSIIFFILAVGFVIFAFKKQPGPTTILSTYKSKKKEKWPQRSTIAGGVAIVFAFLAFVMFDLPVPPIYPWLLHLTSIV